MYIFGADVPLVEVFVGISILMLVTFLLIVYILIRLAILNKKINKITTEEEEELRQFKSIRKGVEETRAHEEEEVDSLRKLKNDIEKILEAEREQLKAAKKGGKVSPKKKAEILEKALKVRKKK